MSIGLLGNKIGMTQIFDESGNIIPVTILKVGPCIITQIKTEIKDGYNAIQVGSEQELCPICKCLCSEFPFIFLTWQGPFSDPFP